MAFNTPTALLWKISTPAAMRTWTLSSLAASNFSAESSELRERNVQMTFCLPLWAVTEVISAKFT